MKALSVRVVMAVLLMAHSGQQSAEAFGVAPTGTQNSSDAMSTKTVLFQGDGTGGWGIGSSREISPEEYARGDRAAFDGYSMQERGEFMRSLRDTQDAQARAEMDELLGVAKMAGIDVKDPSTRLNKFDPDMMFEDDDDDLDVSVDLDG